MHLALFLQDRIPSYIPWILEALETDFKDFIRCKGYFRVQYRALGLLTKQAPTSQFDDINIERPHVDRN